MIDDIKRKGALDAMKAAILRRWGQIEDSERDVAKCRSWLDEIELLQAEVDKYEKGYPALAKWLETAKAGDTVGPLAVVAELKAWAVEADAYGGRFRGKIERALRGELMVSLTPDQMRVLQEAFDV